MTGSSATPVASEAIVAVDSTAPFRELRLSSTTSPTKRQSVHIARRVYDSLLREQHFEGRDRFTSLVELVRGTQETGHA